ncbi:MAG: hypothetical protein ACSLE3_06425 [Microbacteriaceae bacterium]
MAQPVRQSFAVGLSDDLGALREPAEDEDRRRTQRRALSQIGSEFGDPRVDTAAVFESPAGGHGGAEAVPEVVPAVAADVDRLVQLAADTLAPEFVMVTTHGRVNPRPQLIIETISFNVIEHFPGTSDEHRLDLAARRGQRTHHIDRLGPDDCESGKTADRHGNECNHDAGGGPEMVFLTHNIPSRGC